MTQTDGNAFERRKVFGRLGREDESLLAELRPIFGRHADRLVDEFYAHLLASSETSPLLSDQATVGRLKDAQRDYLESLTSGRYDAEYVRSRERIGLVHERLGVEPQWFVGTYGMYLDLLMPLVHEHFEHDAGRATRACAALSKLVILDAQIVLDAYYTTRRRRAVGQSERLAEVGELAASIAHEVRNPLAGMKGALQVLGRASELREDSIEIVGELIGQIDRLEHLVRDLLAFARPRPLAPLEFDPREMLDRVLRQYAGRDDAPEVAVRRDYDDRATRLVADPDQIEQLLFNLVQNAYQAMEGGGALSAEIRRERASTRIALEDSGHGVRPDHVSSVFQPFFTTRHRGSGLGLPIVRRITEAHGGTIVIGDGASGGCRVTVDLPDAEGS